MELEFPELEKENILEKKFSVVIFVVDRKIFSALCTYLGKITSNNQKRKGLVYIPIK